jgi:hypothetical protein
MEEINSNLFSQGVIDRLLGALTGNEGEGNAQMVNQTKDVS